MKSKKISRRSLLRASLMGGAGAALAACVPAPAAPAAAPAAPAAAEPAKPAESAAPTAAPAAAAAGGTVVYWFAWSNLEPAMKTISQMPELKEALGGATFEWKSGVNNDAVLTAVAGGTPPDGASNINYVNFMAKGQFQDLGPRIDGSGVIKKDDFIDASWKNGAWKGVQYGVPGIEHFLNYGLNFNSQQVQEAGLDPAKPPVTWSETLEWHKKLTKFDAAGNVQVVGLDPYDAMAGETDFQGISFGFTPYDENTNKHDFNNAAMIESLKVGAEFYKVVGPDKMVAMRQVEGQGGWGGSFNAGVQSMLIEGYWHPGETAVQKPEVAKVNVAAWAPVSDARAGKKVQGIGGHFLPIFTGAKNPDGMWKFIEFMIGDKPCDILFKEVGWLPSRKSYLGTVKADAYPGLKFYIDAATTATDWLPNFRRSPIHGFIQSQYQELREAVYRDKTTADEAAAELQKRVDTEWKNQGLS
jgi:multiple sugar transport system substrate-binding protein